jgi:hypothetical protein
VWLRSRQYQIPPRASPFLPRLLQSRISASREREVSSFLVGHHRVCGLTQNYCAISIASQWTPDCI